MEAMVDGQLQLTLILQEQRAEGGDEGRSTILPSPAQTQEAFKELRHEDYKVAWVSALPIEMAAAGAMLDNVHKPLPMNPNDSNVYVFGDVCGHNVVIACLPSGQYGTTKAAIVANNMRWSFPSIGTRLMVGIGGGVPSIADIRLGDVVVSNPAPASSGVIQYDFGKTVQEGRFQQTGVLNKPPQNLLAGVARLRADHEARLSSMEAILSEMRHRNPSLTAYSHQGFGQDRLYEASYDHVGDSGDHCNHCDLSQLVRRPVRSSSRPLIHYGVVASANQVMKHGTTRDRVAKEHGVLCFEMEAAGLMDHFPCLVIRGICDYSDSHKNKRWQEYAAATAAAYAKELLSVMLPQEGQASVPSISLRPAPGKSKRDNRKAILETLTFDRIDHRHANIKAAQAKTCQWLSKHPYYESWLNPEDFARHHGILWISGKPGTGKSTIMKHAFTRGKDRAAKNAAVISFFFSARGEDLEKTTIGMHRSLLLQLLENLPELQAVLDDDMLDIQHKCVASDLNLLRDLFSRAISNLGKRQVTCFIDALDECAEDEVRQMLDFFEDLGQCTAQNNTKFFTCFSSRHYPFVDIQYGLKLTLEDQPGHDEDMEEYIRTKLKTGMKKTGEDLVAEILKKASGVFMWIVLVVDILNKEFSRGRIFAVEKRLREIPPGLSDLFRDILTRDNENMEDLLLCVQWVLFGKQPLTREEYYCALVAGLEPGSLGEWDSERVTEEVMDIFVVSSSKGLAEVTKSRRPIVQFIHESVRDFLLKDYGLKSLWPQLGDIVEYSSHDTLKKCCNAYTKVAISPTYWPDSDEYLLRVSPETLILIRSLLAKKFPFLGYATKQLLHHAYAAAKGLPQSEFLQDFSDNLQQWIKLNNLFEEHKVRRYRPLPTLKYIFAEWNCESLVESISLVELNHNTSSTFSKQRYHNPLFAAIHKGSHNAFRSLLDCATEEDVNHQDKDGNTLLLLASGSTHTANIEMLLHAGADINIPNKRSETPLKRAFRHWNQTNIRLLLSERIRNQPFQEEFPSAVKKTTENLNLAPTSVTDHGRQVSSEDAKLLTLALQHGDTVIAGLLIESGANIHVTDANNNSCLHLLCGQNISGDYQEKIITLCEKLCQLGINLNHRNNQGQTPLHQAVTKPLTALPKLLLELGADIDCMDNQGRTPLFLSFQHGTLEVTRMLLGERAQLGVCNNGMESPLKYTIRENNREHVKLLLSLGIDVNERDENGESALFHACGTGDAEMVECLVQGGANVNIVNKNGQNVLSKTNRFAGDRILKTLLRAGLDLTVIDHCGQTVLHMVAGWWITSGDWIQHLVQQALQLGLSIDLKDKKGKTPLIIAVSFGQRKTAAVLLQSDADPDMEDNNNHTPLMRAIKYKAIHNSNRGFEICRLLLESGADVSRAARNGETALTAAEFVGDRMMKQLLLEWMSGKGSNGSGVS